MPAAMDGGGGRGRLAVLRWGPPQRRRARRAARNAGVGSGVGANTDRRHFPSGAMVNGRGWMGGRARNWDYIQQGDGEPVCLLGKLTSKSAILSGLSECVSNRLVQRHLPPLRPRRRERFLAQ